MKSPQLRSGSPAVLAALRSELERLGQALRELAWGRTGGLRPALVPIPAGEAMPPTQPPAAPVRLSMVFGRRKEGPTQDQTEEQLSAPESGDGEAPLPPIPSASAPLAADAEAEDESGSWSMAPAVAPGQAEEEAPAETPADAELPAWGAASYSTLETPGPADADDAHPWGGGAAVEEEPSTFTPSVLDPAGESSDNLGWLQSEPDESAPWGVAEPVSGYAPASPTSFEATPIELDEVDEIAAEAPVEEASGGEPEGLDSFSESVPAEEPWSAPTAVVEEPPAYPAPEPEPEPVAVAAATEPEQTVTRSFPLPEGEVVFRNLRAGFTDPARLLRHLAAEGHTGVLHVEGVDGSNSYVVLVDGYVVAVASDKQGTISTSNRISFPNFPNSQDIINVISYSRQIARGLGLLLHAPVRFAGLGAMFVNLEGLRSYLSKYGSSGGLIVHAQDGVGVALFEEGKLLGGYANSQAPTSDLGQLRDLVKDLEAEIDVRFGGPSDLAPIPLDILLAGYPL